MEWDPKVSSWDFAQLDREGEVNTGSVIDAPSGGIGRKIKTSACSVDLKLGGLGDFGTSGKWKEQSGIATMMASPSGSSKRARQMSNGNQNVSCLVDGCKTDLSSCREYHRRHKVCEAHSKTAIVLVGGKEQRFCQQCSRFHLLGEFDEVKRSCRKRLDGHNKRRRKPQLEPMNSGSLFANYQGPRFSSYRCLYPNTTLDPNWAPMLKNGENESYRNDLCSHFTDREHPIPSSCFHNYKDGKHFPFLQEDDATISNQMRLEAAICQPLLNMGPSPESSHRKIFVDGLTSQVLNSDCALSLLSSSPTQASSVNQGHIVPANRIPFGQPLVPSMQQYGNLGRNTHSQAPNISSLDFSCPIMDNEQVSAVMVSNTSDTDIQCHGIFVGSNGSFHGTSHALPFTW